MVGRSLPKITVDLGRACRTVRYPANQKVFAEALLASAFDTDVKATRRSWGMNVQEYLDLFLYGSDEMQDAFWRGNEENPNDRELLTDIGVSAQELYGD